MPTTETLEDLNVLDFDLETVAAGFADPRWVPQKITCAAYSWVGDDEVWSAVSTPAGIYGEPGRRAVRVLEPLLEAIDAADILTGHNIIRFDLPVLNAECMRLGLEPVRHAAVQDTIKFPKSKGFKKGQDNLGRLMNTRDGKLPLDWQAWDDAYDDVPDWPLVRRRCESDVVQHKQLRAELIERGLLRTVNWSA